MLLSMYLSTLSSFYLLYCHYCSPENISLKGMYAMPNKANALGHKKDSECM
jgi:hypothetical protein